jgi:hypothetical protein
MIFPVQTLRFLSEVLCVQSSVVWRRQRGKQGGAPRQRGGPESAPARGVSTPAAGAAAAVGWVGARLASAPERGGIGGSAAAVTAPGGARPGSATARLR